MPLHWPNAIEAHRASPAFPVIGFGQFSILQVAAFSLGYVDGLGAVTLVGEDFDPTIDYGLVQPDKSTSVYTSTAQTWEAFMDAMTQKGLAKDTHIQNMTQLGFRLLWDKLDSPIFDFGLDSPIAEWMTSDQPLLIQGQPLVIWPSKAAPVVLEPPILQLRERLTTPVTVKVPGYDQPIPDNLAEQAALQHVVEAMRQVVVAHRRLLITSDWRIGNVHPQAQKGDRIVLLQGSIMPVILRQKGTLYKVIGDAWIQGFVEGYDEFGESMKAIAEGKGEQFDLC